MNAKDLKQTVIDAAKYLGKFDPMTYGEKHRAQLIEQAQKLVEQGKMRWEILDNGRTIYTLE